MSRKSLIFVALALACFAPRQCPAAPKPHVISFGKWISAKWPNATGGKLLDLRVRALFVDTRLKEYTTGIPHELTDRMFVVRRAFRMNDALPTENASGNFNVPHWQWQRGGWLLVDLKKDAGEPAGDDDPDSECPPPVWERTPMRVTFQPDDDQKLVFNIRSRVVDVVNDAEEPEE
jgi:hypothetical protein